MARPSNTDARRAAIAAALQRVMARTGYERASVAAIAREAGLSPGLVHYHFRNKLGVLLALVAAMEARVARRVEHALSGAVDPWGRVDALLHGLLALGDEADAGAAACWAQIGAEAQRIPEVGAAYRDALARWRGRLIEALAAAGAPDPIGLAQLAVLTAEGAWRVGHGAPGLIPPGDALPTVRGLVRRLGGAP